MINSMGDKILRALIIFCILWKIKYKCKIALYSLHVTEVIFYVHSITPARCDSIFRQFSFYMNIYATNFNVDVKSSMENGV